MHSWFYINTLCSIKVSIISFIKSFLFALCATMSTRENAENFISRKRKYLSDQLEWDIPTKKYTKTGLVKLRVDSVHIGIYLRKIYSIRVLCLILIT